MKRKKIVLKNKKVLLKGRSLARKKIDVLSKDKGLAKKVFFEI
jgi:hypothetical protein